MASGTPKSLRAQYSNGIESKYKFEYKYGLRRDLRAPNFKKISGGASGMPPDPPIVCACLCTHHRQCPPPPISSTFCRLCSWLRFHPYINLFSFRKRFYDLFLVFFLGMIREKKSSQVIAITHLDTSYLMVNSLTTVGYLLDVFIKLWIPSMVRIFTSAWS